MMEIDYVDSDTIKIGDKFRHMNTYAIYTYIGRNHLGLLNLQLQDAEGDDNGIRNVGKSYFESHYLNFKEGDKIEYKSTDRVRTKMVDESMFDFSD